MSSVSTPTTPTKTTVFRQVERKPSSMSATTSSRPASSSSAGPAPTRPLSRASTSLALTRSASAGTKAMGPPPTPISSGSSVSSTVTVTAMGPITPVTPTMSISPASSAGDAPVPISSITPSVSVSEFHPNSISSAPMVRTTTPPMSSIASAATAKAAAVKEATIASFRSTNNYQQRSLKSILQTIIDSVDEARIRQTELDDTDDMLLEISELKGQLEASNAEFSAYREHMDREMISYKEKKEKELRAFKLAKERELNDFKVSKTREIDEYKSKKEQEVRNFKQTKESELVAYKTGRAKEMEDIKASKAAEIAQMASAKAAEIAELTAAKTAEVDELMATKTAEIDELKAARSKDIEEAVAVVRDELEETRRKSDDEISKLRTERDTAVFTKESLMEAFEARYAEWDVTTRLHNSDVAQIEKLKAELKKAVDQVEELTGSLNELRATHSKCAAKDNEFTSKTNGLTMEVAAMMVKAKLKTKEANEAKKQATEFKRRYEKCQNRLGMLTLDTEDIASKFRDLDNSFHDLAWNFFGRELPDSQVKLSDLPGALWSFPQVQSNSKAAQCLRAAMAEAIISHKLSTHIFQQFYLPEAANVDFDALYKVLRWMDRDHAEQAQVIRCQIAMVCERFPEIVSIPTATAAEVCDLLHPWLEAADACKAFQDGLTLLMQRAMAIWQQMQRGSQLARAVADSSEQQWLAAEDARDKYSALPLDDAGQAAAAMALAGPEFDVPLAVLFPQIHFGSEICFSGHALFPSQPCVVAARAERNATNPPGSAGRRRTADGPGHHVSLPPSSSAAAIAANAAAAAAAAAAATSSPGPVASPTTEHVASSAASITSTRPARSSSRQSVQNRFNDVKKKFSLRKKGSVTSIRTANDSGIGTPTHDGSDAQSFRQGRSFTRILTQSMSSHAS